MSNFDPNSSDAQFATILKTLQNQNEQFADKCDEDRAAYALIMSKQDLTNGRVTALEKERAKLYGIATGVSVVVGLAGWAITTWLRK